MEILNFMNESIKQLLVLSWINANAARRQDILNELEAVAATQGIKLIKEVIQTISAIAEAEQVSLMASKDYYLLRCFSQGATASVYPIKERI